MKTKSKTESNSIIIIGVTILMAVVLFGALATYIGTVARDPQLYNMIQSDENFIAQETQTLQVDEGITSHSLQVYNNTWLEFDGETDITMINVVNSDYSIIPENSTEGSISLWYKPENVTKSGWLFGRRNILALRHTSSGEGISFGIGEQSKTVTSYGRGAQVDSILQENEWIHIVGTFKANQTVKLYINGSLMAESSFTMLHNDTLINSNNNFRVGYPTYTSDFINGSIDDVRYYTQQLNENQIRMITEHGRI